MNKIQPEETVVLTALSLFGLAAAVLNTFCIAVIYASPLFRGRASAVYIVALLCVHVLQGAVTIPLYIVKRVTSTERSYYPIVCDLFRLVYLFSFYVTCLLIFIISLDRVFAAFWLTEYKVRHTMLRAKLTVVAIISYALLICMVPFAKLDILDLSSGQLKQHRAERCHYNPQKAWTIAMLIVNAVLPYGLSPICHIAVGRRLERSIANARHLHCPGEIRKTSDDGGSSPDNTNRGRSASMSRARSYTLLLLTSSNMSAEQKVFQVALTLAVTYAILWLPSIVYYILTSVCPTSCFPDNYFGSFQEKLTAFLVKVLIFLESVVAPYIYCFNHSEFQKAASEAMRIRGSDNGQKDEQIYRGAFSMQKKSISASPFIIKD